MSNCTKIVISYCPSVDDSRVTKAFNFEYRPTCLIFRIIQQNFLGFNSSIYSFNLTVMYLFKIHLRF